MGVILVLNTVPEEAETGVPIEEILRLHVVSVDVGVVLDPTVKVYITRGSDAVRRLAYQQDAGGFQSPYDHADSWATYQASPSSAVDDELWLGIKLDGLYTSLEPVLVEVEATSGGATTSTQQSYTFIIEDLTAPVIQEAFWLKPWRVRLKFDEALNTLDEPGGSSFIQHAAGASVGLASDDQGDSTTWIIIPNATPLATWIGSIVQVAGSAYPENNQPRPIIAIDAANGAVQVSATLRADDGRDYDEQGTLVQSRTIKATVSPYYFTARLTAEGASYDEFSAERVQCAYCPMPISLSIPTAAELPADADYRRYVVVELEDDISYGRLYTVHAAGVEDIYENATSDATFDFESPWFGVSQEMVRIWMNGMVPPPDRREDLDNDQLYRKLAVVLQDTFNMMAYRVNQLQYLQDPDRCPDNWVDFLLYDMANPFRFQPSSIYQKRLLAASLPGFYNQLGLQQNIIDFLYLLLGIRFTITVHVEADYWTLNTHRLGITTTLGPGTAWARNSWEIESPETLTDAQRAIVLEVGQWADPLNMHLVRIIEPGDSGALTSYWVLGTSALGLSTTLSS